MTSDGLLHRFPCVQFIGEEAHVITLNLGHAGPEMCITRASHLSASFSFTGGPHHSKWQAAAEKSDSSLFRTSTNICVELKLPFDEENYG